ncbi:MAG TPA: serine/threonine-protein kinase, partial [Anaeromyxobacter sp.]
MTEAPARSRTTVQPGALTALLGELARAPGATGWSVPARPEERIGRFEILREIGRGGFGVVYEARDTELGRSVAFKAIRAGSSDAVRELRALAEAEAAARLAHPNIVHLYDVGRCERGPFLIMELLHGETLDERLARTGPFKVREAVHVATEIARGLAHAHEQGVVHRDLKPGNVFLCQDGQVKVLDFGLAHVFGRRGMDGGTPAYMAP